MFQGLNHYRWVTGYSEIFTAAGALNDDPRQTFMLPVINLYTTFGVVARNVTAGSVLVKVRFGFTVNTPVATGLGINFPVLNNANDTFFATVGFGIGAAAPNAPGSAPAILPPVAKVYVTIPAGTDLRIRLMYACLGS